MKKLVLAAMLGLAAMNGPAMAFSLPHLFQGGQSQTQPQRTPEAPVILAQSSNDAVLIQQLQDQVRQLNGRVEEMSYQLLQMQEQMRKTQEDNEFRFQDLEKQPKKKSEADTTTGQPAVASARPAPSAPTAPSSPSMASSGSNIPPIVPGATNLPPPPGSNASNGGASGGDDVAGVIGQSNGGGSDVGSDDLGQGPSGSRSAPGPATLGSMQFDQNGNMVGAQNDDPRNGAGRLPGVDTGGSITRPQDQQQTASLGGSEGDAYKIAYDHILGGNYSAAEKEFTAYVATYPKSARIADANFWLGESQFSQGKYNEAAKTFLSGYQAYGKTPKAPEMLLKLGMSLAQLDDKDTACATLKEVNRRYPSAAKPVLAKAGSEIKRLSC